MPDNRLVEFATNPADGTKIAYTVTGDGPPLLMMHGSVLSHQIWRTFGYVRALRERRTLILIDARGHGRSDTPHEVDAYSMDSITGDLIAVLDELGHDKVDYLGYSFGGRTGLHLIARAPERLRSMVIGGAGPAPQRGELDKLFFPGSADVIASKGMEAFVDEWAARRSFPVDSGTRAAFVRNDAAALAAYFRASDLDQGLPDSTLTSIDVPVQYFVGSLDASRIDDVRRAAALTPGSKLETIRGYDHGTAVAAPEAVQLALDFFV